MLVRDGSGDHRGRKARGFRFDRVRAALLLAAAVVPVLAGCSRSQVDSFHADVDSAKRIRARINSTAAAVQDTGGAPAVAQKTGWATIKGKIVVVGTPPSPGFENVNKDQEVCQPGGKPVPKQTIVVSPDGGLANVALFAKKVAGENVHESAASNSDDIVFDQKQCIFLSHMATMRIGQKLKVLNSDSVSHNTLIEGKANPQFNQTLASGQQLIFEPKKPEALPAPVSCSVHPWMRAYLMMHENGYVIATDKDGTFEIANLPAGIDVKIQLWHEAIRNFKDVEINGQKATLPGNVLSLTLKPDETKTLEIKVPAANLQ